MKRLVILFLLLASPCFAGGLVIQGAVCSGISSDTIAGGGTCSSATNEVGDRTQETTSQTMNVGYAYVYRAQADCTGTLSMAYIYHNSAADEFGVKIAIYTSNNAAIASDTALDLVGITEGIDLNGTGWKNAAITGSVNENDWYWICIFAETGGATAALVRNNSATLYYRSSVTYYATPPDPLPNTGWSAGALAPISVYVAIGE